MRISNIIFIFRIADPNKKDTNWWEELDLIELRNNQSAH